MIAKARGFTLIEIAIVLVIIGLLLGGVLKGQELIQSARVRNLISQKDGVTAAFYGFQDRYRALPGDYASASTNITCISGICLNGNGNGQIEAAAASVSGSVTREDLLVWTHLGAAGFLNGSYNMAAADSGPLETNSPKNAFGTYMQLASDALYGNGSNPARHNLKTGNQIPVEILAEVDRKVDDGQPYSGVFQFSTYTSSGSAPIGTGSTTSCLTGSTIWQVTGGNPNCGAATLY